MSDEHPHGFRSRSGSFIRLAEVSPERWPEQRSGEWFARRLGLSPNPPERLNPQTLSVEDAGDHLRKKVVLLPDDPDPLYTCLLVPKYGARPAPAVLCLHSTTEGSGKDVPAGVAGYAPGSPPVDSRAYALHLVRRGYVVLVPDMLGDGERVAPGYRPYDVRAFYRPASRDCPRPQSPFVKTSATAGTVPLRLPYGLFTALFDTRIKAVVCNGGVLYWSGVDDPCHWAREAPTMVHLPALRPYYEEGVFPCAFWECLAPIAPRRLLCMDGEADGNHPQVRATVHALHSVYRALGGADNLAWHTYPGGHASPRRPAGAPMPGSMRTCNPTGTARQ